MCKSRWQVLFFYNSALINKNITDRWHFISSLEFLIHVHRRFPIDKGELIGPEVALCTCRTRSFSYFARLLELIMNSVHSHASSSRLRGATIARVKSIGREKLIKTVVPLPLLLVVLFLLLLWQINVSIRDLKMLTFTWI